MKNFLDTLFPTKIDNTAQGSRWPVVVFTVIAVVSFTRSCIHLLAPDGGAGSIAGMDLAVQGAAGIIFAFGLWGSAQLIYALVQLLVAFRYHALVPLMYALLILEVLLRELVGRIKPVSFAHTPPGALGNYILLPLAAFMLAWCLWEGQKKSN